MSVSDDEGLSKLFAELNEQREKISGTVAEMNEIRESETAKNKMVKATVDGQGRLTELVVRGDRWRDLSQKELGATIVEAVTGAQDKARKAVTEAASAISPAGMNMSELFDKPDIDALFPDFEKMRKSFDE